MDMRQLRDLELRHLVALDAVATEGTFGRAATRLGYTQSAVSQQIAALERLVGGAVFDRPGGPRPVELTPLGKLVLGHARDVIARVDATGEAVERFLAGEVGRIDVGTFQSVSNVLLPAIVRRLRSEHPDLDIRLFEHEDTDSGAAAVLAGELDLTFAVGAARRRPRVAAAAGGPVRARGAGRRAAARAVPDRRPRTTPRSSATRRAGASRRSRTGCWPAAPTPRGSSGPTTTAPSWPWCAPGWAGP